MIRFRGVPGHRRGPRPIGPTAAATAAPECAPPRTRPPRPRWAPAFRKGCRLSHALASARTLFAPWATRTLALGGRHRAASATSCSSSGREIERAGTTGRPGHASASRGAGRITAGPEAEYPPQAQPSAGVRGASMHPPGRRRIGPGTSGDSGGSGVPPSPRHAAVGRSDDGPAPGRTRPRVSCRVRPVGPGVARDVARPPAAWQIASRGT